MASFKVNNASSTSPRNFSIPTTNQETHNSRPASHHHRPSSSTNPMSVPSRHTGSRNHAHSISLGSLHQTHRVTRRKSMTSNALSSVTAALQGMDGASLEAMVSPDERALTAKAAGGIRRAESSSTVKAEATGSKPYSSMNYRGPPGAGREDLDMDGESAIIDGQPLAETPGNTTKVRNRRASDGAYLSKTDAKRASGDLRCEKCGKGYKHSSCLTKHLLVPL